MGLEPGQADPGWRVLVLMLRLVSMNGADDPATQRRFAAGVVAPLPAAQAVPLAASKTDFVRACKP